MCRRCIGGGGVVIGVRGAAVDVQSSGAVDVDAVEVGADLVAEEVSDQYVVANCERLGEAHLGPYLLW